MREGQAVRAVRDDTPTKAKLRPSSEAAEGEDAVLSWTEDEAAGGRRCTESMEEELKMLQEVERKTGGRERDAQENGSSVSSEAPCVRITSPAGRYLPTAEESHAKVAVSAKPEALSVHVGAGQITTLRFAVFPVGVNERVVCELRRVRFAVSTTLKKGRIKHFQKVFFRLISIYASIYNKG